VSDFYVSTSSEGGDRMRASAMRGNAPIDDHGGIEDEGYAGIK